MCMFREAKNHGGQTNIIRYRCDKKRTRVLIQVYACHL